jgi:hypothetical protein
MLFIRDGIPVPEDKTHKVLLRKPEALAEAEGHSIIQVQKDVTVKWKGGDSGKAKGLIGRLGSIDAGKTLDLEASWAVKTPTLIDWTEVKTI